MPRRISDYPDAFAGWNLVSSFGSLVSVIATYIFLDVLYVQLTKGKESSRYPWLTPQFYIDILRASQDRAYDSLEWGLNSPPKPHSFVSLPLQSKKEGLGSLKILLEKAYNLTIYYLVLFKIIILHIWNLMNYTNFKLVLNLFTYNNFLLLLKKIWQDKYLLLSIFYISLFHRILPQNLAIHLGLMDYNFYTLYIGLLYAVISLFRSLYRDFYIFSWKSFVCNIAIGILIYNLFVGSMYLISILVVFYCPLCTYDSYKNIHQFFKEIIQEHINKTSIDYINYTPIAPAPQVTPTGSTLAHTQYRWAFRKIVPSVWEGHVRNRLDVLQEFTAYPTSDVISVTYNTQYTREENFLRFKQEIARAKIKILGYTRIIETYTTFVNYIDNTFTQRQQENIYVSALRGNALVDAGFILASLNHDQAVFMNRDSNFTTQNINLSELRTFAQAKVNYSNVRMQNSSNVVNEIKQRGVPYGWNL